MSRLSPPRAPALLARALRPLPLAPLQPFLAMGLQVVLRSHPTLAERLHAHAAKRFGLDPIDLPFAFVLTPGAGKAQIRAVRALPARLDATIAGPMAALVGLVVGAYDGDALVFSRDLVVEGDMEAVLALRNAIDDAEIDPVRDIAGLMGRLGRRLGAVFELPCMRRGREPTPFRTAGRPWS